MNDIKIDWNKVEEIKEKYGNLFDDETRRYGLIEKEVEFEDNGVVKKGKAIVYEKGFASDCWVFIDTGAEQGWVPHYRINGNLHKKINQ